MSKGLFDSVRLFSFWTISNQRIHAMFKTVGRQASYALLSSQAIKAYRDSFVFLLKQEATCKESQA
jgi:hypothetical protein